MADMVRQTNVQDYFWIKYIRQRIRQNKNFLFIISGQTGSGKSWTGLSIGELINKDFDIGRVIFTGKELMTLVNSEAMENKKGIFIMWDEAGVDLSNKNWQQLANKMINFLIQTFRHRCFILCFTAPYSDFIDKSTRKLFHAEFKTVSIDFHKRTVKIKPQLIQYNSRMGKFYYKYLRVATKEDGVIPIVEWNIFAPSAKLVEDYERKKNLFTSELNRDIERQLKRDDARELPRRQEDVRQCWLRGIFLQKDIAKELSVTQSVVSVAERGLRRRGVYKEDYKQ